jgi:hypothetical protein
VKKLHGKQIQDGTITQSHLDLNNPSYSDVSSGATVYFVNSITSGITYSNGVTTIDNVLRLSPREQPSSPVTGMIYIGNDDHIYCYLNSSWKMLDNQDSGGGGEENPVNPDEPIV